MPVNLSYELFPILPEASINENTRPGTLFFEYFEAAVTIGTNEGTVEVPTALGTVLGIIDLHFVASAADPTDTITLTTDGVITTGAVTVNAKSVDIGDGAVTIKGFLVGKKADTVLLNSPV